MIGRAVVMAIDVMLTGTVVLFAVLIAASLIDAREQRLPDWATITLLSLGFIVTLVTDAGAIWWSATGATVGFGFLWLVRALYLRATGRDGLGLGDAKLLAAAGAWLGPLLLAPVVFIAAASGLLAVSVTRLAGHPVSMSSRVPFGPFLSLGIACCWTGRLVGLA